MTTIRGHSSTSPNIAAVDLSALAVRPLALLRGLSTLVLLLQLLPLSSSDWAWRWLPSCWCFFSAENILYCLSTFRYVYSVK